MRAATYVAAGALGPAYRAIVPNGLQAGRAGVSVSGGVALAFKVALRISYHLDLQSFSANICRYGSCASSFEMYCIVY